MTRLIVIALLAVPVIASAQSRPTPPQDERTKTIRIYVEPHGGFESYISAAMIKKHSTAIVTQNKSEADFVLTSAVLAKDESAGSKFTRCLFMYCAGMYGIQTATVQLVNPKNGDVVWAYNVIKASSSAYQSTAEAIAKHLNKEFLNKLQ